MVFVNEEKIIQVTPNISCRFQHGKEVEVVPFGEGWKYLWNDTLLYIPGNLQLTFYFVDGTKRTETYPEALWHYVKSGTLEQDICDYVCGQ